MKLSFAVCLYLSFFFSSITLAETTTITLSQITQKVSKNNYKVLENAERLYQAKKKISLMRANLLPRLNIWKLLNIPTIIMNPWMAANIATDIAPFLVPSNWFNVRKSKWNYRATKEQYRAIWANEVFHARQLYLSLAKDIALFGLLQEMIKEYELIREFAINRNYLGLDHSYVLDLINSKYFKLLNDERELKDYLYEQKKTLLFHLGENVNKEIQLEKIQLPNIDDASPVEREIVIHKAVSAAPEAIQFKYLLASLKNAKTSVYFSILGTSPLSAQAGNGVYDNIPAQDGLGFGIGASLKISKSKERELRIRERATVATIELQSTVAVNNFNSTIEGYEIVKSQLNSAMNAYQSMLDAMNLGEVTPPKEMTELLHNDFSAQVSFLSTGFDFLMELDRIQRLTFSPPYNDPPKQISSLEDDRSELK